MNLWERKAIINSSCVHTHLNHLIDDQQSVLCCRCCLRQNSLHDYHCREYFQWIVNC
jgi:hypothetical protein